MSQLPRGTVTFLFSDIEGSTVLLRQLGQEQYGRALADYQRLVRGACGAVGGTEVDTQGDSFFFAFPHAGDAVQAAADVERALAVHVWPDGTSLRARIGLHTGEASVSGDRYVGLSVHRAARVGASAAGGQVLLSHATASMVEDEDLGDLRIHGVGRHVLKDFDRPALTRAAGYLAAKRTDQMLPSVVAEDAGIYPLQGADVATARRWLSRARIKPTTLVLYAWNAPQAVTAAQVFAFDLKQIGIDVDVKYFSPPIASERTSTRGEPYDVYLTPWAPDYADPAGFLVPLLDGRNLRPTGNTNVSYFDDPRTKARIDRANRLTGDARRRAWAELDVDLMRTNPPWAPFAHFTNRHFVSRSLDCIVFHPVYGDSPDLAAACKK